MRSLLFLSRQRNATDATPSTEAAPADQSSELTQPWLASPAASRPEQNVLTTSAAPTSPAAPTQDNSSLPANASTWLGGHDLASPLIAKSPTQSSAGSDVANTAPTSPARGGPTPVGGDGKVQILVQFKAGMSATDADQLIKGVGGTFLETVRSHDQGSGDLIAISVNANAADAVIAALSNKPGVSFAEYNWTLYTQLSSTDTYYTNGSLWGMYGDGTTMPGANTVNTNGSQAGEAWGTYEGSQTVIIGNIDSGIDYRHPDLYRNIWLNQNEIPTALRSLLQDTNGDGLITFIDLNAPQNAKYVTDINKNGYIDAGDLLNDSRWENGIDEDGNGYQDDLIGWDFANNDNDPFDDNNHGTHTAGTIGALANGTGVIGVAPNVQIVALKFLSSGGSGYLSNAVKAIDYYTDASKSGQAGNFVATSNSWGGGGYTQSLLDAIVRGALADILFVAAAGNGGSDGVGDNNDSVVNFPSNYSTLSLAGYEAVIAVAALTSSGVLASFSNFGSSNVDLAAPGQGIWSTVPGGGYASFSGTSMATPHVSGALALLAAAFPYASASQLSAILFNNVNTLSSLSGKVATGGTLDIDLATFAALPNAPADKYITVSASSISLAELNSGSASVTFTITLTSANALPAGGVSVDWSLQNITTSANDFASGTTTGGKVTFTDASKTQTITINIQGDTTAEAHERFAIKLSSPTLGFVLANDTSSVTILNDDADDYAYASTTTGALALTGANAAGVVSYAGDLDAFKVTLEASKSYCFDLTAAPGSALDGQLALLNSSFSQISLNDDLAIGALDSRIVFTTPSSGGDYYLAAGGYSGSVGSYSLKATPALVGTNSATVGDTLTGTNSIVETLIGLKGADTMTGGSGGDIFIFNAGDSGQTSTTLDRITDFTKSTTSGGIITTLGDVIDYQVAMSIGGSAASASASQARIDQATGVATFAKNSGTSLSDALADIAARFTAATNSAGEFALFQVNKTGDHYLFISDGVAGVTADDVVVRLTGVTSIGSIGFSNGNLAIA